MKRDSSNGRSELSDFLLIPPAATIMSLGMVLPEYWLILVCGAFLVKMILVIVQKVNRRNDVRQFGRPPENLVPPTNGTSRNNERLAYSIARDTIDRGGWEALRVCQPSPISSDD